MTTYALAHALTQCSRGRLFGKRNHAAPTPPRQQSSFQLDLSAGAPLQKVRSGRPLAVVAEPFPELGPRTFGVPLERGESLDSPFIETSSEHILEIRALLSMDQVASCELLVSASTAESDAWTPLARLHLSPGRRDAELRVSLQGLTGPLRFRVGVAAPRKGRCLLALFRVCAAHEVGRTNALTGYEARLSNEMGHFSATAYTHALYGDATHEPCGENTVSAAGAVIVQQPPQRRRSDLHALAMRSLQTLAPVEGELAFNYALRALQHLLPVPPLTFFSRMRELGVASPARILSIMAGAARVEESLLQHCPGDVELTLMDASACLIERAAERFRSTRPGTRVNCLVGDVNKGLPGTGEYDVIMCVSALHHVADIETVLAEVNHRLADEGEFWSIGEQIGRNGNRLWPDAYRAANEVFCSLPAHLRRNAHSGQVDAILSDADFSAGCFEGIRSEELESALEAHFLADRVFKRNAFLWRLVDATYCDNFDLGSIADVACLREVVAAEAVHWAMGGRSTELHGIYRKKRLLIAP